MRKEKHLRRRQIKALVKMTGSDKFWLVWDENMHDWVISEEWYTEEEAENIKIWYSFYKDGVFTYGQDGRSEWNYSTWKSLDDEKVDDIFINTIMAHDVPARDKNEMEIPSRYWAVIDGGELRVYGELQLRNPTTVWTSNGGFFD